MSSLELFTIKVGSYLGGYCVGKIRRIIVGIVSIIYLILFLMKIDIPKNVFLILIGIISISQVIDEWNMYKETGKKIHLIIPICLLVAIIFLVLYLLF